MTLPSSRRPKEVEELMEEELKDVKVNKICIDLKKCFMDQMVAWYSDLTFKLKKELTKKRVIRKAIEVTYKLRLPYENLPTGWLRNLFEQHGVEFRFSRRRKIRFPRSRVPPIKIQQSVEPMEFDNGKEAADVNSQNAKIIDLTQEPPPAEWIESYLKGQNCPRTLCHEQIPDGRTVIFYDYSTVCIAGPSNMILTQHAHNQDGIFPRVY